MGIEERGVGRGDDDVGVGHEMQPGARAHAVDGGHHRLPHAAVPRRHPQLEVPRPATLLAEGLLVGSQLAHVEAGLESVAVAGVDDHAHVGVGVELGPCLLELDEHGGVDGVADVGPVEHQPTDRPTTRHLERRVAHEPAS